VSLHTIHANKCTFEIIYLVIIMDLLTRKLTHYPCSFYIIGMMIAVILSLQNFRNTLSGTSWAIMNMTLDLVLYLDDDSTSRFFYNNFTACLLRRRLNKWFWHTFKARNCVLSSDIWAVNQPSVLDHALRFSCSPSLAVPHFKLLTVGDWSLALYQLECIIHFRALRSSTAACRNETSGNVSVLIHC